MFKMTSPTCVAWSIPVPTIASVQREATCTIRQMHWEFELVDGCDLEDRQPRSQNQTRAQHQGSKVPSCKLGAGS